MEELFFKLSPATLINRIFVLKKLGVTDPKDYKSLLNKNDTLDYIYRGAVSSQKNKMMHLLSFLKAIGDEKLMNWYYTHFKETIAKAKDLEKDGKTNDSETYIPLDELQKKLAKHRPTLLNISKFGDLTQSNKIFYLNQLQDYILMLLYIENPPIRNDYAGIKVSNIRQDNCNDNYLLMNTKGIKFFLNKFKNASVMGPQIISYTPNTNKYIKSFLTLLKSVYPTDNFICIINKQSCRPITKNELSHKIKSISYSMFGHPYNINSYRHMWETAIQSDPKYMNLPIKEREAIHKQLLHSMTTALNYKIIE